MITHTTEIAIRALLYIALRGNERPVSVQETAGKIDASPAYTAKIVGQLVKAGILSSQRGTKGGVCLTRPPEEITFLDIVQACQGLVSENYCQVHAKESECEACGYHMAMRELHDSITRVLSEWNLGKLMDRAIGKIGGKVNKACKMYMMYTEEDDDAR